MSDFELTLHSLVNFEMMQNNCSIILSLQKKKRLEFHRVMMQSFESIYILVGNGS